MRAVWLVLLLMVALTAATLGQALGEWQRPLAGTLVDPFGRVDNYGWPGWNGYRAGLGYSAALVAVEGRALPMPRGQAVDAAARDAQREGRATLTVTAAHGTYRDTTVRIEPLGFGPWMLLCGCYLVMAWIWLLTAALSYLLRPQGRAVRVFVRWAVFTAVVMLTAFDLHTTRRFVPLFLAAYALSPTAIFEFGLCFPERVRALVYHPRLLYILRALDGLLVALVLLGWLRGQSYLLLCDLLLAGAVLGVTAVMAIRCARAEGRRRAQLRLVLGMLLPVHVTVGTSLLLPKQTLLPWGPYALVLMVPLSSLGAIGLCYAMVRYDLWDSRAVLQRPGVRPLLTAALSVLGGLVCALLFLTLHGGPLWAQLGLVVGAAALLGPLHGRIVGWLEAHLFKAEALYRRTVEQLSVRFTDLRSQAAVVETVEQAVRRVCQCERVQLVPLQVAAPQQAHASTELGRLMPRPAYAVAVALSGERLPAELEANLDGSSTQVEALPQLSQLSPAAPPSLPPGLAQGFGDTQRQRRQWRALRQAAATAGLFGLSTDQAGALSRGELVYLSSSASMRNSAPVLWTWLVLPARFRDEVVGLLAVSPKTEAQLLTSEDQELLRTIANQAALALACARALAEIDGLRRAQEEASRQQLDTAIGTLAAEVAHEIRFPINFFRVLLEREQEALQKGQPLGSQDLDEDLDIGREEVARLERMADTLRRVAQRRPLQRQVQPLRPLFLHARMLLRDRLKERALELDVSPALELDCDRDALTQVLLNLLANALDACPTPGRVGVSVAHERDGRLRIVVWDAGPGFAEPVGKLFQPWFTTKPNGSGLGLAIAHRLVRAHGWTLGAERRGERTCFDLLVAAGEWRRRPDEPPAEDAFDTDDPT